MVIQYKEAHSAVPRKTHLLELFVDTVEAEPTDNDVFTLHTYASMGVRGVLNVFCADEEMPLGFYARKLRKVELNYSATVFEALAVTHAVEHFAHQSSVSQSVNQLVTSHHVEGTPPQENKL